MNDMKSSQTLVLCNVSNPLRLSESHRTKAKSVYSEMTGISSTYWKGNISIIKNLKRYVMGLLQVEYRTLEAPRGQGIFEVGSVWKSQQENKIPCCSKGQKTQHHLQTQIWWQYKPECMSKIYQPDISSHLSPQSSCPHQAEFILFMFDIHSTSHGFFCRNKRVASCFRSLKRTQTQ